MINVGEKIKHLRELKGVSRKTLAFELGLSLSGYSKLERGETDLPLSKLYKISEVLEVDVAKILDFDAQKVFNISNNQTVQGVGTEELHLHNHISVHTEKYISTLENEIQRLKAEIGRMSKK